VPEVFKLLIDKRDAAEIHGRTTLIPYDRPVPVPEDNPPDAAQFLSFFMKIFRQFPEGLFSFSAHNAADHGIPAKHCRGIIGHLTMDEPNLRIPQYLWQFYGCLLHILHIPQITRKTDNIQSGYIQIHKDIVQRLIYCILPDAYFCLMPGDKSLQTV